MDFLRDPIWQFIGAVLALIALFVSILLFILQRRKKTLAYEILSKTELLTTAEGFEGKVQILFEGQNAKDVNLLVFTVTNNGNIPIASSDFENPLTFIFGKDSNILSAEIIETVPKTLKPTFTTYQNKLVLTPTLLNSGDVITFKLLLAQYDGKIDIDTRIIGVSEVKKATGQRTQSLYISLAGTLIVLISMLGMSLYLYLQIRQLINDPTIKMTIPILPFMTVSFLGLFLIMYGQFRTWISCKSHRKYISKSETETKN